MCVWRSQAEVSALRAEAESARAEGAASLAMEHGKRQALDEAHREAQATGTRLRGELRAAREEVDRLRREAFLLVLLWEPKGLYSRRLTLSACCGCCQVVCRSRAPRGPSSSSS